MVQFTICQIFSTFKSKTAVMNTNPEKYKWGLFYFDPNDSRVILPKVNRIMGWTLNFAKPVTYIIIIAFIALIVLLSS